MKISKVNHVKAGVSSTPIETGGMIYSNKAKDSSELREHIDDLNKRAGNLYSIFTPIDTKGNKSKYKLPVDAACSFFKNHIVAEIKEGTSVDSLAKKIRKVSSKRVFFKVKRDMGWQNASCVVESLRYDTGAISPSTIADYMVDGNLRQSLRKKVKGQNIYVPDVVKKIVTAVLSQKLADEVMESVTDSEMKAFLNIVKEDFTKEKRKEEIAKSIENQNVQVQVDTDGEYLILASAYNPKKQYVFEYLKEYAEADKEKQSRMLGHMHGMIHDFVYSEGGGTVFSEELEDIMLTIENTKRSQKAVIRSLEDQYVEELNQQLVSHYQVAISRDGLSANDKRWMDFISNHVAKTLNVKKVTSHKLQNESICKAVWEEWLSYIAKKYIEMGKAAYNFALGDLTEVVEGKEVSLGKVPEKYKAGISSFDYERLKAEDDLKRGLTGYVSFALNNFESSVRSNDERVKDGREDILTINKKEEIVLLPNAKKRILRYFGGASKFTGSPVENLTTDKIVESVKDEFVTSRNSCFHYVSGEFKTNNKEFIENVLDKEYASVGAVYRKKYFSNNVPAFYKIADIDAFMDNIYSKTATVQEQVPSFNKVLSRNIVEDFMKKLLSSSARSAIADPSVAQMYYSSIYFVLKEIYYYDFIQRPDLKERFVKGLELNEKSKDANKNAMSDFKERLDVLNKCNLSFGEICQEIMTEYNQQNNQKKKNASAVRVDTTDRKGIKSSKIKAIEDDAQIYKHFRTLLYVGLRNAFMSYIKEEKKYAFIKEPENRVSIFKNMDETEFTGNWNTSIFDYLRKDIIEDNFISAWYVTAHFLDQKNLNHLIGTLKNYMQFVVDIEKRAKATGNKSYNIEEKVCVFRKLVKVLEFCKLYCGQVSNIIDDYFDSLDEYAKYISKFVDFNGETAANLQFFCEKVEEANYYDGSKPIPNRNVILSTLYGNQEILAGTMNRIVEKEFTGELRNEVSKLGKIFSIMECASASEQAALRKFQNLKNRLELVDIKTMTELINDLYGQLINYSYLRERDLLFMQMGFYYVKLFHTESVPQGDILRTLHGDCDIKDGAVLYQIAAMYNFDLPLYSVQNGGEAKRLSGRMQTGIKVPKFIKEYCSGNADIYKNGLVFFEDVDGKHKIYTDFRNYVDHFKFFANHEKSLLELYSDMFNGFFSYDIKLKKSISYILPNILLRYFINAKLTFDYVEETVDVNKKDEVVRKTCITLKAGDVKTDYFTYKINSKESKESKNNFVAVRNKEFLDQVVRIMNYKR